MWTALEDEADDSELPIRIGRAISVEAFDPPLFAAICSEDLNQAARRIGQYKKLIGPMRLAITQSETETTLEYVWPDIPTPPAILRTTELVFWVALVRLTTRSEVMATRATSPEPPPEPEAFREYLGVPVVEGPSQSISFSAKDASRPFLTANEGMWEYFEPGLKKRLSELDRDSTTGDRVRAALLELLPVGEGSMDAVARRLWVSTRTLQRRLKEEGTTFQVSLNETRENLARHYLATSKMPTAEISFLLGYEEPNSFYRAFRSWTGQTPEQVREAVM